MRIGLSIAISYSFVYSIKQIKKNYSITTSDSAPYFSRDKSARSNKSKKAGKAGSKKGP